MGTDFNILTIFVVVREGVRRAWELFDKEPADEEGGGEDDEEIPDQEDQTEPLVHPPAVVVAEQDQEEDGRDQDDGRVEKS